MVLSNPHELLFNGRCWEDIAEYRVYIHNWKCGIGSLCRAVRSKFVCEYVDVLFTFDRMGCETHYGTFSIGWPHHMEQMIPYLLFRRWWPVLFHSLSKWYNSNILAITLNGRKLTVIELSNGLLMVAHFRCLLFLRCSVSTIYPSLLHFRKSHNSQWLICSRFPPIFMKTLTAISTI